MATIARDVTADIRAANERFENLFKARDAAGIAALYTADGMVMPPNSDVATGHDAIGKFWRGVLDAGLTDARLETVEVQAFDDTAFEEGRYKLAAGANVADEGKYIVVWKFGGNEWRLYRDIWNSNRRPAK